jgi:hypothetical protein
MARLQEAGGGDGLQRCRIAVNILNKQSRTADRGWVSSLGVGQGADTTPPKKTACYEVFNTTSDLDGFFGTNYTLEN